MVFLTFNILFCVYFSLFLACRCTTFLKSAIKSLDELPIVIGVIKEVIVIEIAATEAHAWSTSVNSD